MKSINIDNDSIAGIASVDTINVVKVAVFDDLQTSDGLYCSNVYTSSAPTKTVTLDVSPYNNFRFQFGNTVSSSSTLGTASFWVSSSVDGVNWVPEFSVALPTLTSTSSISTISGYRGSLKLTYSGSSKASGSCYILCAR